MQLVAYGAQDVYLTGNPQITFWKVTYRRHTNFSLESIEQTFNGQADFGRRVTCTISRNGDLAYRTYLQVTLPEINQDMHNPRRGGNANAAGWGGKDHEFDERINDAVYARWLDCPGEQIISQVEVEIGGQRIDRQYGDWMHIWQQLTLSAEQERGYNKMIGNTTQLTFITDPTFADVEGPCDSNTPDAVCAPRNALPETTLYVPLQFWYCRNPGLALPLIALQYHEVKINLDLRPIDECLWAVQTLNCSGCPEGKIWDPSTQTCVDPTLISIHKHHHANNMHGRYNVGENVKVTTAYNQSLVAASLYVDYVFLDTDERRRMAQNPHEYLIEQLQFTGDESVGSSSNKIKLNFNHPCKELIWVVQPDSNVDYCSSLECGATLFSALGAQPFNYTDSLDALPNALHAFSGPRSAANNSDPNTSPHWSFIGPDGLFAQPGAADNNTVTTTNNQFWNVANANNRIGQAKNNLLGGGAYGSAGGQGFMNNQGAGDPYNSVGAFIGSTEFANAKNKLFGVSGGSNTDHSGGLLGSSNGGSGGGMLGGVDASGGGGFGAAAPRTITTADVMTLDQGSGGPISMLITIMRKLAVDAGIAVDFTVYAIEWLGKEIGFLLCRLVENLSPPLGGLAGDIILGMMKSEAGAAGAGSTAAKIMAAAEQAYSTCTKPGLATPGTYTVHATTAVDSLVLGAQGGVGVEIHPGVIVTNPVLLVEIVLLMLTPLLEDVLGLLGVLVPGLDAIFPNLTGGFKQKLNEIVARSSLNRGFNAINDNPPMAATGDFNQGGGFYDGGVGPVSFVSDAGAFVLNETSLTMHCWGENPVVTAKLQLNGQDRFSEREGTYFDLVQPYQHHTRSPDTGINVYSFSLRPEEHQPSGTCNFSRIDNATLQLVLSNNTVEGTKTAKVRVYATNYNVLRIMSGMGGLAYSN